MLQLVNCRCKKITFTVLSQGLGVNDNSIQQFLSALSGAKANFVSHGSTTEGALYLKLIFYIFEFIVAI